jgi:hypothetical protein
LVLLQLSLLWQVQQQQQQVLSCKQQRVALCW